MRIPQTTRSGVRWPRQTVGDFPSLDGQHVALTIDDGPTDYTEEIVSVLDTAGIVATFFLIGELALDRPDLVARILDRGHNVGLHGWTHTPFSKLTPSALRLELRRARRILPVQATMVRPPYGDLDRQSLDLLKEEHLEVVGWSVHCEDWLEDRTREELAIEMVGDTIPGDILLVHDRAGAGALIESVVSGLAAHGLAWTRLHTRW